MEEIAMSESRIMGTWGCVRVEGFVALYVVMY